MTAKYVPFDNLPKSQSIHDENNASLMRTEDMLKRSLKMTHSIKETGSDTLVELDRQKDIIVHIEDKLNSKINPNIAKGRWKLKIMEKAERNKIYIVGGIILTCVGIIIMLIVLIIRKHQ